MWMNQPELRSCNRTHHAITCHSTSRPQAIQRDHGAVEGDGYTFAGYDPPFRVSVGVDAQGAADGRAGVLCEGS